MPRTFFAICQQGKENNVFRVPLSSNAQTELEEEFDNQERLFFHGRDEEIPFDGGWKPETNQLLVIEDAELATTLTKTLLDSPAIYRQLDISDHAKANVKGIFTHSIANQKRILLQRFQTSQYLQKVNGPAALVFKNNKFGRLSIRGFNIAINLTAVIEENLFKFISYYNLRTILPVKGHFELATDEQIATFKDNASLSVEDVEAFDAAMNEASRKLIRSIICSDILDEFDAQAICERAGVIGLQLRVNEDRLVLPKDKKDLLIFLNFLNESAYTGTFSGKLFVTNSKRTP